MRNVRIIIVSVILLLFISCRVKDTVTTERASANMRVERVLVDSIILRDSVVIRERCDTVFFTKYRTLYKERLRHDTVVKCDTVYTERVVTVKDTKGSSFLWLLLLPLLAVLWKVGVFDLLRKIILRK